MSTKSLRKLKFQKSYLPHAEGSCLVSMGQTKVLCVATVEDRVPPHAEEKGMGWIHAEYAMLPRSGERRTGRGRASGGGRSQEISRLIGRSLRSAVRLEQLGPITITVDCDVIRADGGTRTASINGGMVALAQALKGLWRNKELETWPLLDFVGAVSAGLVNDKFVLDMDYLHDKDAQADLNVVMTAGGNLVEVQGTAEGRPFSTKELNKLINFCHKGIRTIVKAQKKAVGAIPKVK